MADRVSARAFARLDGCDEKLVRKGVEEGRLQRGADGLIDAAMAGSGWRARNRLKAEATRPGLAAQEDQPVGLLDGETPADAADRLAKAAAGIPVYAVSLARKEHFLALLRELEYREKLGSQVDIETAKAVLFEQSRAVRNAWLGWPANYAAQIAAELDVPADRCTEVLTAYVHKQAAELGEPSGRFGKD
jgi:hypothetical protein